MSNFLPGPISQNDLMKKLVQAKKVINKVDNGDYQTGNINPDSLVESENQPQELVNKTPKQASVDQIKNSKLPDSIKRAMIENPIPQISLNDTIDMDIVKGAKRLMEQEGISKTKQSKPAISNNISTNDLVNTLTPIIENIIMKSMDTIVEKKINQILNTQQSVSINENLVLKVGDSIFKGKITGVNKSK